MPHLPASPVPLRKCLWPGQFPKEGVCRFCNQSRKHQRGRDLGKLRIHTSRFRRISAYIYQIKSPHLTGRCPVRVRLNPIQRNDYALQIGN